MFDFLKNNWRKLLVGGCGVVGGVALVVPALIPAAAICAVVTPVALAGGSAIDILRAVATKKSEK